MDSVNRTASDAEPQAAYVWKDHSRYVEIHPVRTGWLVIWGRYEDAGGRKLILGNQTYRDPAGARRRLADAIIELTRNPIHAADALALLDRQGLPAHTPRDLPAPL